MLLLIQVHENTLIFDSYTRNKDLKTKRDLYPNFPLCLLGGVGWWCC